MPSDAARDRVDELRLKFAQTGRVVIEDAIAIGDAEVLSSELRTIAFTPIMDAPIERQSRASLNMWHHRAIVEVDPKRPKSALEAFVRSLTGGPLCDFIGVITRRKLCNHLGKRGRPALVAYAYPRGGYLEEHSDDFVDEGSRRSLALVWHASPRWDKAWGGELHFMGSPEETVAVSFGALHVFDATPANRHEVMMVTGPEVRYTLSGFLYNRSPRR